MELYLGDEIPWNVKEELSLDIKNGDNKWKEAVVGEFDGIQERNKFKFLTQGAQILDVYQYSSLKMISNIKSDLRWKARLVAGVHLP
jgi:hypothetical protein